MTVREFYDGIGVSADEVIGRFGGSEAMLERFLKKFLDDKTFEQLCAAMQSKDWDAVFAAAHTLKGLTGNFDFHGVREPAVKIVEQYRANNFDAIPPLFETLKAAYADLTEKLRAYLA